MRKFFFLGSMLMGLLGFSQTEILVLDGNTTLPVSFADVLSEDHLTLGLTNEEGKFIVPKGVEVIVVSALGYTDKKTVVSNNNKVFYLEPEEESLMGLIITPKSIIKELLQEVQQNQRKNNPTSLNTYQFFSYNKLLIDTAHDSIRLIPNPTTQQDSAFNTNKRELDRSAIYISERVMEHKYRKGSGEKNIVQASRMAGFTKTPLYEFLASQPIPMYLNEEEFNFFVLKFVNPVSLYGLQTYRYTLRDTIDYNNRKTLHVTFHPKKEEDKKNQLQGYFYIDEESKALTKFYGEFTNDNIVWIDSEWIQQQGVWFPTSQQIKAEFGRQRKYPPPKDSLDKYNYKDYPENDENSVPVWFNYTSTYKNRNIDLELQPKEFRGYKNELGLTATENYEEVFATYRDQPITPREDSSYYIADSIFEAEKVGKYLRYMRIATLGKFQTGKWNWNVKDLFKYNDYEGFRLNIGGETNPSFHKDIYLNGYLGYGFKDQKLKWSVGGYGLLNRYNDARLGVQYIQDVMASGRLWNVFKESSLLNNEALNEVYYGDYWKKHGGELYYQQDFFRNLSARFSGEYFTHQSKFGYQYKNHTIDQQYQYISGKIQLAWQPFNEYMSTPYGKLTLKDKFPKFYIQGDYTHDVEGYTAGFSRAYIGIEHDTRTRLGKLKLRVKGGKVWGETPIYNYFEGQGTTPSKNSVWDVFLASQSGFETMIAGDFYSDAFVSFSARQYLPPIFTNRSKRKTIVPELIYQVMYGDMNNNNLLIHNDYNFQVPHKLYQEVGFELNGIFSFLGVGAYYRFGAYNTGIFEQDFFLKLTFDMEGSDMILSVE